MSTRSEENSTPNGTRNLPPAAPVTNSGYQREQRAIPRRVYLWLKALAAASLPLAILCVAILAEYGLAPVFDSPFLVSFLNTVFISLISFVFAYVAVRAYVRTGIVRLLLLGCATLTFGLNSGLSGFLLNTPNGANHAITAYNIAALAAGALHLFVAALFNTRQVIFESKRRRLQRILLAYVGIILISALLSWASVVDLFPPFFIPATGPTLLRQIVLGSAIACWASAAVLLLMPYRQSQTEFLYWYGLALAVTATGLGAVFFQSATGSLLNWTGRLVQELGGVYFGVAVSLILREAQIKGIALELQVASFFRDAEANYRTLVETATDAIIAVDRAGTILLWNPAAEQMFGYSKEEALGAPAIDLLSGADSADDLRGDWENYLRPESREPGQRTAELIARRKDGERFPIELSISTRPQLIGFIRTIILRDITERKRADASLQDAMHALRLSEERFRTALKHAPITVYNQDVDLNYTWAFNPSGMDSTDLVGKQAEFIVSQPSEELNALKRHVIETGTGSRQEMWAVGLDGRKHFYDITVDPLRDASGNVIGVTCAAIDVTEHKLAAERIQQLNCESEARAVELEVANRELEAFAYSVSHDLRTPLSSLVGLARVLEEDHSEELPPAARHYVGLIQTGMQQMDELIQGLLGLAHLSRHALKKQPVQMAALVREALAILHLEPGRRNPTLDLRELSDAQADPVLLKQVWVNLIGNAVKFTRTRENAIVEIGSMSCEDAECAYYVRDNGVGFDMDQAGRLFGLFQRMHGEEEYEGTGVGLAIVARIVRRHGGRVWAEAEVDKGATFYFTLGSENGADAAAPAGSPGA